MSLDLTLPPIAGGGLVPSWTCSARCRHCLYACGPERRDGRVTDVDGWLDGAAERAPRASWHVGGGEPFLDVELLGRIVAGMQRRRMPLQYVETNASWVRSASQAREVLRPLAAAGLPALLVSLSPFHAEHVPLGRTLALAEAAREVLPGGAFLWLETFLGDLEGGDPDARVDLDALLTERGPSWGRDLVRRYGLVTAGRAGRFLVFQGGGRPLDEVAGEAPCRHRLTDTSHVHVDGEGRFVPGLCAGLALPLGEVPGPVDLERYPALRALWEGGPGRLLEAEGAPRGFTPLASYASACDLCTHLRRHLAATEPGRYPELGPPGFYDRRSMADFA